MKPFGTISMIWSSIAIVFALLVMFVVRDGFLTFVFHVIMIVSGIFAHINLKRAEKQLEKKL